MRDTRCRITLETRDGRRIVSALSEREAALKAESVLRQYEHQALTVGFCVDCADRDAGRRITAYLIDLALELDLA